jgi:hypothetical protein
VLADSAWWIWAGIGGALVLGLAITALRPAWVTGFPRLVLSLLALCTLVAAAGLVGTNPLRLTVAIDPSTDPLLPAEPEIEFRARLERAYEAAGVPGNLRFDDFEGGHRWQGRVAYGLFDEILKG